MSGAGEAWERGLDRIIRGERQWRNSQRRSKPSRRILLSKKSETDAMFDMVGIAIGAAESWAVGREIPLQVLLVLGELRQIYDRHRD